MLKRTNKGIALIVAAATIISTIPVMASEKNKIERLNESDGSITNAVAFSDGKYLYEGSKSDADNGVYYYDGAKDKKLDNVDDLDEYTKYGDSFVVVPDGSSEEKINLADGTVSSDGDRNDALTTAKTKLKTTLSKTNKYGSDTEIKSFTEVSNNKFGDDVWYSYTATGNESYYKDETVDSESNSGSSDQEQPKSQIEVTVRGIWGQCSIAGKTFSGVYGVDALKEAVLSATFTGYKVKSATVTDGVLTFVLTTTEDLKNTVPNGFISENLTNWSAGYAEAKASAYVSNLEPKSQVKVIVRGIWGQCSIAGKTFSGIYSVDALKEAVLNATFTGYAVKSATVTDNVLTFILTTSEDLGNAVPNGFISENLTNWSAGYAEATASAYVASKDETSHDTATDSSKSNKVIYYGYCDSKGNYIDCSKIANINVYNGKTVVKMENFNDKKIRDNITVKVGLPKLNKTLGQDKNYIYSLIEVPVIGYQPVNASAIKPTATTTLCYVQKIAKVHSNTKDGGAYVPQDVDSYYLCNDCGWDGGDNWSYMAAYNMLNDSKDDDTRQIRIIDGNIFVAHNATNDKGELEVTYGKLKLKSGRKITPVGSYAAENKNQIIQPIVYDDFANNTKIGDNSGDTDSGAWTIDTKGNAWAIYNGRIKMSGQANEWQDMYRCSMMNRLSVYDESNLIAWDSDGDNYVTVRDGEVKENAVTKTGWQKTEDGKWHLYDLTGKDSKGWINYNSCLYYFDDQGVMQTGWLNINDKTYYLTASGVRQVGWAKVDGEWYYLDESGVKQVNTTIDGYKLNSNGVRID